MRKDYFINIIHYCLKVIYKKNNKNMIGYCFKYEFTLSTQNKMNEKIHLLGKKFHE